MAKKKSVGMRLSDRTVSIIDFLAQELGLNKNEVVANAVDAYYRDKLQEKLDRAKVEQQPSKTK